MARRNVLGDRVHRVDMGQRAALRDGAGVSHVSASAITAGDAMPGAVARLIGEAWKLVRRLPCRSRWRHDPPLSVARYALSNGSRSPKLAQAVGYSQVGAVAAGRPIHRWGGRVVEAEEPNMASSAAGFAAAEAPAPGAAGGPASSVERDWASVASEVVVAAAPGPVAAAGLASSVEPSWASVARSCCAAAPGLLRRRDLRLLWNQVGRLLPRSCCGGGTWACCGGGLASAVEPGMASVASGVAAAEAPRLQRRRDPASSAERVGRRDLLRLWYRRRFCAEPVP